MSTTYNYIRTILLAGALLSQTACHRDRDNQPPSAVVGTAQPSSAQVTTYAFSSAGSSDSDGRIVSYHWDFGDGSTSDDAAPTHIFAGSGTYVVTLTLKDDLGASTSVTQPVTIAMPAVSVAVTAAAATVTLPQSAVVSIPEGAFPVTTRIGVWSTTDAATAEDFNVSAVLFASVLRAAREIRVNTGKVLPTKVLAVTVSFPAELEGRLQANDEPQVFVQIFQDAGEEVLDHFELIPSVYDPAAKTLRIDLEPGMLTDTRTSDDSWEAIVLVGSTRTRPTSLATSTTSLAAPAYADEQARRGGHYARLWRN